MTDIIMEILVMSIVFGFVLTCFLWVWVRFLWGEQ